MISRKSAVLLLSAIVSVSIFTSNASAQVIEPVLGVTQITALQTYATADGTFDNGWKWAFDVTVPEDQTLLKMKFADWVNGANIIPAGSNVRFYSAQSTNASDESSAITVTASSTWSDLMYLNSGIDLNVGYGGRQIQVIVEARIPEGSAGGSYSTSYGINTTAPAIVTIDSLTQTYSKTGKFVTVTTDPLGLDVKVTYDGSEDLPVNVGTYDVFVEVTDSGYTGTSTAELTVNPAPIAVTADLMGKVYGSDDPEVFTYQTVPPLFEGDSFTGALTRVPGENVGAYLINQGSLSINSNYVLTYNPNNFTITPAPAEVTINALVQTYNKTGKSVTVTTVPGGLPVEVTYNGSAGLPVNAGTYEVVATVTDPNYDGEATGDLIINPAPLTVTATTDTKIYDGTENSNEDPTITSGELFGDDNGVWTQAFNSKNASENVGDKILTPSSDTPVSDGNGGNNYDVTLETAVGTITKRDLTVTATGVSKTYDGTTGATVDFSDDRIDGDLLEVSGDAQFEDKEVGDNKRIIVSDITVGGVDAGNYSLTNMTAEATANITKATLTVTANSMVKIYGDSVTFEGTEFTITGLLNSDSVEFVTLTSDGAVATAPVSGSPYNIVSSNANGVGLGNYDIKYVNGQLEVTKRPLTANVTANDRPYNGTTNVTFDGCFLDNIANDDGVTCQIDGGSFENRNVGASKTVTANVSLVNDAGNYTVTSPVTTTAEITTRPITVTAVTDDKTYDGMVVSDETPTSDPLAVGDSVTWTQEFDSEDVGDRTLTPIGTIDDDNGGNNYDVRRVTAAGTITQKDLTVIATGVNKPYDGTTAATVILSSGDKISGDDLNFSYAIASFLSKDVGNGKQIDVYGITVGGTDSTNYNQINHTASTTADITKISLMITANNLIKTYGDLLPLGATSTGFTTSPSPLLDGDSVTSVILTSDGTVPTASVSGSPYPIVPSDAGGIGLENYAITYTNGTLTVNRKTVTGTIIASDKTYDGTTEASTTCSLIGKVGEDDVGCVTSGAHFNSRNAGNNTVTADLSLSGEDAGNYDMNLSDDVDAAITQLAITITAQPNTKVYDGNKSVATTTPMFTPELGEGDLPNFSEAYEDENAGTGKKLIASGKVIDGNEGNNYTYVYMENNDGVINKADQTVTFTEYPDGEVTGNSFSVVATASSGLDVTFTGGAFGVCTVHGGGTVDLEGSGQCPVTAQQMGDGNFNTAPDNTMTFRVSYNVKPTFVEVVK